MTGEQVEKARALAAADWSQVPVAKELRVSRASLHREIPAD